MILTGWTTLAALALYFWITANVGRARGKYKIDAPSTDGPLEFQCVLRVQINTVEQMVMFVPALWLCAAFFNDFWAMVGGAVWIVGRILYAIGYYRAPSKRGIGFVLSLLATVGLTLAAAAGLLLR